MGKKYEKKKEKQQQIALTIAPYNLLILNSLFSELSQLFLFVYSW